MPTDIASYKNTKYGSMAQFSSGDAQGMMSMVGGMSGGGSKKGEETPSETYYDPASKKEIPVAFKSPSAFKLRSGNTSAFKMLGSSPAKFFGGGGGGGLFGSGAIGSWFKKIQEKRAAKREARMNKRLGITPTAPGGGDGSHTHGGGGGAIGGAQAVTAQAASPEMPAEGGDEEMVA